MSPQVPGAFKYDLQSITKNAPPVSGVYTLFSPSECLYVGESDDICASLLETFFGENPSLNGHYPTQFTFELVSPNSRVARQADRIRELGPVCNLGVRSPQLGHIRGPQAQPGVKASPVAPRQERETPSPSPTQAQPGAKASPVAPRQERETPSPSPTNIGKDSPRDLDPSTAGQGRPTVPIPAGQIGGVDGAPAGGDEKALDLLPGHLIRGRYRMVSRLATGKTGTVYVGEQVSTGKKIALKVFRPEISKDEAFVSGFRQVMAAVRALANNHSSVLKVYECDRAEDGRLFLAMELLDGRTLSDVIRQDGPLAIERALRFARQMAEGLDVAHDFGIVHADVRPQNFMVIGKEEDIKILGFERARLRDVAPADRLVASGVISRTPEYAAPEQIKGDEITKQTDVYAFGVVLYEMLTGMVPFKASTPEAVLAMHLKEPPTPLKAIRPEIPGVIEAKVLQALEKEPKRRQAYVSGVADESLYEAALFELDEETRRSDEGRIAEVQAILQVGIEEGPSISAKDPEVMVDQKLAATQPTRIAPQEGIGQTERSVAKVAGVWAGWKLAAIAGLLIVIAGASLWVFLSRGVPEIARAPLPPQKSEETQVPAVAGKSVGGSLQTVLPSPQERTPSEGPPPETSIRESAPPEPHDLSRGGPEIARAPLPTQKSEETQVPAVAGKSEGGSLQTVLPSPQERIRESAPPEPHEMKLPPVISSTPPPEPMKDRPKSRQGPAPSRSKAPAKKTEPQGPAGMDPTAVIDWLLKRPPAGKE